MDNFFFKNVKVSCCNMDTAVTETISYLKFDKPNYICVTDVGNIINAFRKSPGLKNAINNSYISLPDGKPLSIFARIKGVKAIDRVAGPDFMEEIFKKTSNSEIKHFFIGDTNYIHNRLKQKVLENHNIKLAGFFDPGFNTWNNKTDDIIIDQINNAQADIIWVSLGGGKQEIWMEQNFRKLNKGIMIGVGAAFRFYTGEIKRAPVFFQKIGLEWFFRLIQQPGKMFKRYATTLPLFIFYSSQEILKDNIK